MTQVNLLNGDNIELLKTLESNSIDSVVTDPPYGLSFMNKKWDYDVPSVEFWKEAYRVLKPGGHILSFGGTRTYHRMVVNMEDAGFEIRDQIMWIYGSGFPKSLNIGKAIDKLQGNEREVVGKSPNERLNKAKYDTYDLNGLKGELYLTKGSSEYEGWGTALKPANEPICVARKPLSEKTIAENVIKWRTGGINIDGCRIGYADDSDREKNTNGLERFNNHRDKRQELGYGFKGGESYEINNEGRFPANIILDETAADMLDQQSGYLKGDSPNRKPRKGGHRKEYVGTENNEVKNQVVIDKVFDSGGASRYFLNVKTTNIEKQDITSICGTIIENQNVGGILDGAKQVVEKYILNAEQFISGNKSTDLYLKDVKYIISILTELMTELKTLCVSQEPNIENYTLNSLRTIKLLMELSIEGVSDVQDIKNLMTSISVIENTLDMEVIVKIVQDQNCEYGEKQTESDTTNTTDNIEASRFKYVAKVSKKERNLGLDEFEDKEIGGLTKTNNKCKNCGFWENQGAGNGIDFCKCEQPDFEDRTLVHKVKNNHPTLKPINLMTYLCRLITPPNGVILDPFMGSGSTGIAARLEGFNFVGMELDKDYFKIAEARIERFELYKEIKK